MGYTKVTTEELHSVSGQLTSAAGAIDGENSRAMGQVNGLVGAGWEGAASGQFQTAFAQWKQGADQVHTALTEISTMLSTGGNLYADTEGAVQKMFVV